MNTCMSMWLAYAEAHSKAEGIWYEGWEFYNELKSLEVVRIYTSWNIKPGLEIWNEI